MKDNAVPKPVYLKDYQPPRYFIDKTELTFKLFEGYTQVFSRLHLRRNPALATPPTTLRLDGGDQLVLKSLRLNERELTSDEFESGDSYLEFDAPFDQFVLDIETEIKPQLNTRLEGLYLSNGMFCTQCEAEGFRHISYYLDRPDVMSKFTTRIEADQKTYPLLLSNGNKIASGELTAGRHWVLWEDPFKKPCYLFALVAGNLAVKEDRFTTMSGRSILLQLYVEPADLNKCDYALHALKQSMAWDEKVYGREYDLDSYMIVAVSHFNMGAMENKGLNIFNTSCVLAHPDTTTDAAFQRVEGVVAHEYFHNWSGNRVTCRDWFQLSLKEGFTVFRDEEFSADMGSRTVKRIEDVTFLRTLQFSEDAGPLAHPVRPESYIEMNNFYTTTVYNKGAEVVRMIHTLVGKQGFRKGCDLYFERFDGQAVTTDDFVACMEEANAIDLMQFKRWYTQAGTPRLQVSDAYDQAARTYTLELTQSCPPTPQQSVKEPFYIPFTLALLGENGKELPLILEQDAHSNQNENACKEKILIVNQTKHRFVFSHIDTRPTPSMLRGFSAPVNLDYPYTKQQLSFLMRHDNDGFNRWEAAQKLAQQCIFEQVENHQKALPVELDPVLLQGFKSVLESTELDKAMVAKMLSLPSENYLLEQMVVADVTAVHVVRDQLIAQLAENLKNLFLAVYEQNQTQENYLPTAAQIAQRSLKNACLTYLMALNDSTISDTCYLQFEHATNMTDVSAALRALVNVAAPQSSIALAKFLEQWKHEDLVVNQWFAIQAASPQADTLDRIKALMTHPLFEITNPNKVRSLIATFCTANLINFHREDGEGYTFLSETVIKLDTINPQIAARLVNPLSKWRHQDQKRQTLMIAALNKIKAAPVLSNDLFEVVSKSL